MTASSWKGGREREQGISSKHVFLVSACGYLLGSAEIENIKDSHALYINMSRKVTT